MAPERGPVVTYLAALSPGSRRTQRDALEQMACLLSGGAHDAFTLPWHHLRYEQVVLLRAVLASASAAAVSQSTKPPHSGGFLWWAVEDSNL